MAIYHYEETPVKRSKGQSAVNSAAYVLKENMRDNNISKDFSYERQNKEVEYSKTLLPEGSNFKSAEEMWNDVEKNEKSEKAVVGQRVHIAIPKELSLEAAKQLVDEYALARAKEGRGVSIAFHNEPGNPHIDAILTPRPWQPGKGWGAKSQSVVMTDKDGHPILNPNRGKAGQPIHKRKNVNIDDKTNLTRRRKEWEELANAKLAQEGFSERIDCRTLKAQRQEAEQEYLAGRGSYEKVIELSRTPTIHEYRIKERKELNEKIKAGNAELKEALTDEWNLEKQICKASLKINRTKWRKNENERRKGKTTEYLINEARAGRVFSASLDGQQNDNINRTIARSNGVSELSKRGVDGTQKEHISANVLLSRIESNNVGNERNRKRPEGRRTYHDVSTSHTQYNRGSQAGAVTVCGWLDLSNEERKEVWSSLPPRLQRNPLDVKDKKARDELKENQQLFIQKSVYAKNDSGNFVMLCLNKKQAHECGLIESATKGAFTPIKTQIKSSRLEECINKMPEKLREANRREFSRLTAGGVSKGIQKGLDGMTGALDTEKTSKQHFKDAKENVKEALATPKKIVEDFISNPIAALVKAPFRVAEGAANLASAAANATAGAAKSGTMLSESNSNSGGGASAGPVRVRTREDEEDDKGLKSWKYLSEARREEEELKAYLKEVHMY